MTPERTTMEPVTNERGEQLLSLLDIGELEVHAFSPVTFALVIARDEKGFLLAFNSKRKVWELPGGMIESDESARQCAARELFEETRQSVLSLRWRGLIELGISTNDEQPRRRIEYGALFCGDVASRNAFVVNEEVERIDFWRLEALPPEVSAIDRHLLSFFR